MPRIEKYTEVSVPAPCLDRLPEPGEIHIIRDELLTPIACQFMCPCGCEVFMRLRLVTPSKPQSDHLPGWAYHTNGHLIHPSVLRLDECKSHFFILEDGAVRWC